jgi:hypothetical protein
MAENTLNESFEKKIVTETTQILGELMMFKNKFALFEIVCRTLILSVLSLIKRDNFEGSNIMI